MRVIPSEPPKRGPQGSDRTGSAIARLALAALPVAIVAALASAATLPNIPGWYACLAKPPFTPPNAVFGPVWTILYALMAFAVWRVLCRPASTPNRSAAILAFAVQLILNLAWSCAFFALRNTLAGGIDIVLLIAAIIVTIILFRRLDRGAAYCLVPYLAWVVYAAYLNAGILYLNR